jgi:broad specificity phosphatase PhoE
MSTRLLLVRHGQIAANVEQRWHGSTDGPLTERGHEQARGVASYLACTRPEIAAVYASPLKRAQDTGAPIAAALDLPLHTLAGLAEYGIGDLENETYDDLLGRHRFFDLAGGDITWAPPNGESLEAVGRRVQAAWRHIADAHPGRQVAVVGHGAAMAIGLAVALHADPRAWFQYRTRNTSVTELELAQAVRLVTFDVAEHLATAGAP